MSFVSVAVQHHPDRAHLIPRLVERLGGQADVVEDPDPDNGSPLRTYLECLRRTPEWATHRLVVQDDTHPGDGFPEKLLKAITDKPDGLICFFAPGIAPHRAKMIRATMAGHPYAPLRAMWIPTVATCWPVGLARDFTVWADEKFPDDGTRKGDDGPVGKWANERRNVEVWATVPSIVEHPDIEPSLIGRKAGAGHNRGRVAAFFDG